MENTQRMILAIAVKIDIVKNAKKIIIPVKLAMKVMV